MYLGNRVINEADHFRQVTCYNYKYVSGKRRGKGISMMPVRSCENPVGKRGCGRGRETAF